jgi:hypothetical protein
MVTTSVPTCSSYRSCGAENLCHQAIFVNHASGAVAPPDAEVVQVGDVIWQWAERPRDGDQVALLPDQGPVQQLTSAAADRAFHDRVIRGA